MHKIVLNLAQRKLYRYIYIIYLFKSMVIKQVKNQQINAETQLHLQSKIAGSNKGVLKDISYLKQYFNVTYLIMLMVNFIIFTRMCLFSYTPKVEWDLRQIMNDRWKDRGVDQRTVIITRFTRIVQLSAYFNVLPSVISRSLIFT